MAHARAGGADAAAVVQYLATLGDADTPTADAAARRPPIAMRSSASTSTDRDRATTSSIDVQQDRLGMASASIGPTARRAAS